MSEGQEKRNNKKKVNVRTVDVDTLVFQRLKWRLNMKLKGKFGLIDWFIHTKSVAGPTTVYHNVLQ